MRNCVTQIISFPPKRVYEDLTDRLIKSGISTDYDFIINITGIFV